MNISQRIFEIMKQKNIKQNDLANFLGISSSSITDWKKKGTNPASDKILKISEFLDVSVEYLLGGEERVSEDIQKVDTSNSFDTTTIQVAEMFSTLDLISKNKVLNLLIELHQQS